MDQFSNDPFVNLTPEEEAAQRSASRDSLLLSATIRVVGKSRDAQVRVRNLSSGGLMAEYTGPIGVGAAVEVEVRGIGWVPGQVAWVTDGRIGIAFEKAIDPLRARKPVSAAKRADSW